MSLGDRIIELRKAAGMNQADLSRAMNVSRQAVSKWETGQASPDSFKLIQLAELLDTDIEYLTTGRRNLGRRPPVIVNSTQIVEKIVEKPVVQTVEKVVEVPVIQYVEKPVIQYKDRPVIRYKTKIVRNLPELIIVAFVCFLLGLLIGFFL